ncbi:hypothetical protein [Paraburkholderia xenovorans]|uniref:hypothetical protein n=1 Tax=Paraburkholderia xenovorans TaxID=36873 RepID=UPI0015C579B7|nr:hypothetical protein [Paraburkholderia xenovorans]NPT33446.1 hypothetical protein [Paraburkholderia xenovorans]
MSGDNYGRQVLGRRYYGEGVIALVLERVTRAVASDIPVVEVFNDPALPCRASFYSWMSADEELRTRFERARAEGVARRSKE